MLALDPPLSADKLLLKYIEVVVFIIPGIFIRKDKMVFVFVEKFVLKSFAFVANSYWLVPLRFANNEKDCKVSVPPK